MAKGKSQKQATNGSHLGFEARIAVQTSYGIKTMCKKISEVLGAPE